AQRGGPGAPAGTPLPASRVLARDGSLRLPAPGDRQRRLRLPACTVHPSLRGWPPRISLRAIVAEHGHLEGTDLRRRWRLDACASAVHPLATWREPAERTSESPRWLRNQ